jgi:hypothetical protein
MVVKVRQPVDFRGYKRNAHIVVECEVGNIPRRIGYGPQDLGLKPLYDFGVGRLRIAPQLNTVGPNMFEHAFVKK